MSKNLITAALVMLTLCACSSSASLLRKDTAGGRVRVEGAYMPAMAEARMLMLEHCHGRYEALELGWAVEFRCKTGGSRPALNGAELALQAR